MTKRAKYIRKFVEELVDLAENGLYIRVNAKNPSSNSPLDLKKHEEAKAYLEKKMINLEGCLSEILENNEEQASALMRDLGIEWIKSQQTENPPTVPPE